jgi:exodeoxyribonuclease-1
MLYSGGFFSAGDRHLMKKVLAVPPADLARHLWSFQDPRLPLMLFRYRARNFPETLSTEEAQTWDRDRRRRLVDSTDPGYFTVRDFQAALSESRASRVDDSAALRLLDQLESWVVETGLARA